MQHKYCFEAVHHTLCDICGDKEHIFGGLPAILGRDWAQILPVVQRGNRTSIIRACFQNSFLWLHFRMLTLRINMRLYTTATGNNQQYADWLSRLSYDSKMQEDISLPTYIHQVLRLDDLYGKVFPCTELHNNHQNLNFWRSRSIFTSFNDSVTAINLELLLQFAGEECVFFSEDSADYKTDDDGFEMSTENLQQLEKAGLPYSKLHLKLEVPVMLLRNLDHIRGLNNGSRLILTRIGRYSLQGQLLGGDYDDELRIISRIELTSIEGDLSFILTRRQFPVQLCFAMTINKSQGQLLNTVGLDLRLPIFCHGQLYVALSRVTDVARMTVLLSEESERKMNNIVYFEVLEAVRPDVLEARQPMPETVPETVPETAPETNEFRSEPDFDDENLY